MKFSFTDATDAFKFGDDIKKKIEEEGHIYVYAAAVLADRYSFAISNFFELMGDTTHGWTSAEGMTYSVEGKSKYVVELPDPEELAREMQSGILIGEDDVDMEGLIERIEDLEAKVQALEDKIGKLNAKWSSEDKDSNENYFDFLHKLIGAGKRS